ncbi:hypothetical protein FACS189449_10570 [Alphaproteobacteria bacterium]|nr:hypothetical protein FACS189449_10570 [Alphaproteobacteria bacterium]
MCPFLDEEDDLDDYDDYTMNPAQQSPEENAEKRWPFQRNDMKFLVMGGGASVTAFCVVAYIMYSNSKPVDIDELPVIRANTTPIKIKPKMEEGVGHQDKVVYDNISGEKTAAVAVKTVPPPEEEVSINGMDMDAPLSDEEKKNIIQAFDDLAPEKEYKINYVKSGTKKKSPSVSITKAVAVANGDRSKKNSKNVGDSKKHRIESNGLVIVEEENPSKAKSNSAESAKRTLSSRARENDSEDDEEYDPPIKRLNADSGKSSRKNKKSRLKDLMNKSSEDSEDEALSSPKTGGHVMVQIASLETKSGAEVEYKRLLLKNKIIRGIHKKIVKVDLGRKKGIRYRVMVGPFKNNSEANKVIRSMKSNGINAYVSR